MGKKVIVLGAGLVGKAIALDLLQSGHKVTAADKDQKSLQKLKAKGIQGLSIDFADKAAVINAVKDFDLVVGAAPGEFGFRIIEAVIDAGVNMTDISFCPEDVLKIADKAKKAGVTVLTDIGIAPGFCNVLLGYHDSMMKVDRYKCIVGGLPFKREWPLEYKAAWSPMDVIEEYTRPARLMENGKMITKPPLSDLQLVYLDPVGSLEEWNSDGLRSLITTMAHIPNMVEKTLRFPGTVRYLEFLRKSGFFSKEPMVIGDQKIRPVDLTAALLFPTWKLEPGEKEFTIMRVEIEGIEQGKNVKYQYDLYDETDPGTGMTSMARTTGYTCTAAAELLLAGWYENPGINPPEYLGKETGNFDFIMKYLGERNIRLTREKS